jgi:hypothetical protein
MSTLWRFSNDSSFEELWEGAGKVGFSLLLPKCTILEEGCQAFFTLFWGEKKDCFGGFPFICMWK